MAITIQHTQESLCVAHICALGGMAGVNYLINRHAFDYGVDGQFVPVVRRPDGRLAQSGYPLDFQAKATTDWEMKDGRVVYDLEAKTFDDMVSREPSATTLMLILLCLPKLQSDWHEISGSETRLRHCCYWQVLQGAPCGNVSTKRIFIPGSNVLTPDTLKSLLGAERARREGQAS